MKRAFNLFAIVFFLSAFALCAFAKYDVIELPTYIGPSLDITTPCKVVYLDNLSVNSVGGLYCERICTAERDEVTAHALTNFTYSVVTTNTIGVATTNVLTRPHPIPYPPTMTGYWTNTVVNAWSVTNRVPYVYNATTNEVSVQSYPYLLPGDRLYHDGTEDDGGKWKILIEK